MKKRIKAVYLPQLDNMTLEEAAAEMDGKASRDYVSEINWCDKFPYKPIVAVDVARGNNEIYINFFVRGKYLLANNTEYNSPVYQDSCVEFFARVPEEPDYYNFEFNCIGTALSSKRKSRTECSHYSDKEMATIRTFSTAGNAPFEEKDGIHSWDLTVAIPFKLLGVDSCNLPERIDVNFYKCGDKTSLPHYVSWNKIETAEPDFHRPEFFGELYF